MEPLQWLFVVTALTLIFVVFAINPLQVAIDETIHNFAQLQAQRIASVINLMSAAPDGTLYRLEMPPVTCRATITDSFVMLKMAPVAGKYISYTISLIETDTQIIGGEFDCRRALELRKSGDLLRIT